MKRLSVVMLCLVASIMCAKAQIGYQISLLNTATGEPRANETVTVSVSLSNSAGQVFYSETKFATTNDFGVLSLSIGNANTFKNVDLTKMPFYIEVTANGVTIGKSQMLSVPVTEVAKRLAPMDKSLYLGTWKSPDDYYLYSFSSNGTFQTKYTNGEGGMNDYISGTYEIEGENIYCIWEQGGGDGYTIAVYRYYNGTLFRLTRTDKTPQRLIKQ